MHDSITAHLVRRGLAVARRASANGADARQQEQQAPGAEMLRRLQSPASITVLFGTIIFFFVISTAVEYAVRFVIGNLAIIESTTAVPEPSQRFERDSLLTSESARGETSAKENELENDEKDEKDEIESDSLLGEGVDVEGKMGKDTVMRTVVSGKPITRQLRTAVQHLRLVGGFMSLFRGFSTFLAFVVPLVLFDVIARVALAFAPLTPLGEAVTDLIVTVLACVATAPLRCAWTHATIRAPATLSNDLSKKGQASRMRAPGVKNCFPGVWSRHLVLPNIRLAIVVEVSLLGTLAAANITKTTLQARGSNANTGIAILLGLLPMAIGFLCAIFVVIPTIIALVRVEASLLPDSDEAIVPFDRSFGGRIDLSGKASRLGYVWRNLSIVGAWRTFEREAFARVMRVYVKFVAVTMLLVVLMFISLGCELYFILGDEVKFFMAAVQAKMQEGS
jgi:hypothetical protein